MRVLLAGLVVGSVCLFVATAGFAQGGCSATCGRYNDECNRQLGVAAAQCQRACGGSARCQSACDSRERTYANACRTRYNQCLRACGRRA